MIALLISIISLLIGLLAAGLVAGFSPMLYGMQVAVLGRKKQPTKQALSLIAGVAAGLTLLAIIFLFTLPESFRLVSFIPALSSMRTPLLDNMVALLCIGAGIYLFARSQQVPLEKAQPAGGEAAGAKTGNAALFGIGFLRAMSRVSGVAALLVGVKMIVAFSGIFLVQASLLVLLLAIALLPYSAIFAAKVWHPVFFMKIRQLLERLKPRYSGRVVGGLLVLAGLALMAMIHLS